MMRAREQCPHYERGAAKSARVLECHERFIVHRVAERRSGENTAMQLIAVAARLDVMVHRDRRIVDEPPARAPDRKTEGEFPKQLRARCRPTANQIRSRAAAARGTRSWRLSERRRRAQGRRRGDDFQCCVRTTALCRRSHDRRARAAASRVPRRRRWPDRRSTQRVARSNRGAARRRRPSAQRSCNPHGNSRAPYSSPQQLRHRRSRRCAAERRMSARTPRPRAQCRNRPREPQRRSHLARAIAPRGREGIAREIAAAGTTAR